MPADAVHVGAAIGAHPDGGVHVDAVIDGAAGHRDAQADHHGGDVRMNQCVQADGQPRGQQRKQEYRRDLPVAEISRNSRRNPIALIAPHANVVAHELFVLHRVDLAADGRDQNSRRRGTAQALEMGDQRFGTGQARRGCGCFQHQNQLAAVGINEVAVFDFHPKTQAVRQCVKPSEDSGADAQRVAANDLLEERSLGLGQLHINFTHALQSASGAAAFCRSIRSFSSSNSPA